MDSKQPQDSLVDDLKSYIETRFQLIMLDLTENGLKVGSKIFFVALVVMIMTLLFILINFATAYFLGDLMGKVYLGFIVLSGFYLIIAILMLVFRRKLIKRILELFADGVFSDDN